MRCIFKWRVRRKRYLCRSTRYYWSWGVEKIIEIKLSSEERSNFEKSIEAVKELFNDAKKIDNSLS